MLSIGQEVEHIPARVSLEQGEGVRLSISKESFLTLKADISKVNIVRNYLFHSKASRLTNNREPKISVLSSRRHLSLRFTRIRGEVSS